MINQEKLEELYIKGIRLFGTKEKFENWLDRESYGLEFKIPRTLLDTNEGIENVLNELITIEFGTTA